MTCPEYDMSGLFTLPVHPAFVSASPEIVLKSLPFNQREKLTFTGRWSHFLAQPLGSHHLLPLAHNPLPTLPRLTSLLSFVTVTFSHMPFDIVNSSHLFSRSEETRAPDSVQFRSFGYNKAQSPK